MSTLYTINVTNNSNSSQDFFFFQAPAIYSGGPTVYSNSLYQSMLQTYANSGSVLTFQMDKQYYAGAQTQTTPPTVGQVAGGTTSIQAVNLTPASGSPTSNATNMSVNPLGLSPATTVVGAQPGAFRIVAPVYNPNADGNFNIGSAVQSTVTGSPAIVSNFIVAQPNQFVDCQPVLTFYVQTGSYTPGQVINFSEASNSAATCDTTTGFTTFNVTYNVDGTWAVSAQ